MIRSLLQLVNPFLVVDRFAFPHENNSLSKGTRKTSANEPPLIVVPHKRRPADANSFPLRPVFSLSRLPLCWPLNDLCNRSWFARKRIKEGDGILIGRKRPNPEGA